MNIGRLKLSTVITALQSGMDATQAERLAVGVNYFSTTPSFKQANIIRYVLPMFTSCVYKKALTTKSAPELVDALDLYVKTNLEIQNNGEQIVLNFKGGDFLPPPESADPEADLMVYMIEEFLATQNQAT